MGVGYACGVGEKTRLNRTKKRILRAMLASPERTWTTTEFGRGSKSMEAVNEVITRLRYLGAIDVVESATPESFRYLGRRRVEIPGAPGRYRLTKVGPECVQMLLDGARPTGVVATAVREGPHSARDAWLARRHQRAWQARTRRTEEGPAELNVSPLRYIARRRASVNRLNAEVGRWRRAHGSDDNRPS